MTKYGYTRVSSKSQENNSSLEGQNQQLIENGILEKNIFYKVLKEHLGYVSNRLVKPEETNAGN